MLRLGLISDIHLRNGHVEECVHHLETIVDRFDTGFQPDHVVVLGDVIEHDDNAATDREHVSRAADILSGMAAPVHYLAGNHDVMNLSADEFYDLVGQDPFHVVSHEDHDLILLDSSAPYLSGARGEVRPEQLPLLDEALAAAVDPIILVHHPVHYHDVSGSPWWAEYPERAFCGNKKEVNQVMDGHPVRAVFNGHLHENDHTHYRGVDHFTVNAFSKEAPGSGVTGRYAEVVVDEETRVTVHTLDRVETTFSAD